MLSCDISQLVMDHSYLESLREKDIDELAEKLKPLLEDKLDSCISNICYKTVANKAGEGLAKRAFSELLQNKIKEGIYIFLAHKHWKKNKTLINYLYKVLHRSCVEFSNESADFYESEYKCISCNYYGQKNVILSVLDNKHLYCNNCSNELNYLEPSKKYNFIKAFSYFSKKGISCNHCHKFVPESHIEVSKICPYPDCNKEITQFNKLFLKKSKIKQAYVSDEFIYNNSSSETSEDSYFLEDSVMDEITDIIRASILSYQEKYNDKKTKSYYMYQAFLDTMDSYPDEFCFYIINGKKNPNVSLQAVIYQNFCKLIFDNFPKTKFDKHFRLFNGYRRFWGFVESDNKIRYCTQEKLEDGEIWVADNDKSYIAYIESVVTEDGENITDLIKDYSFTNIKFNSSVKPLTNCCVTYYSIYPSHTKENMIAIQRIKKQITNLSMKNIRENLKGADDE